MRAVVTVFLLMIAYLVPGLGAVQAQPATPAPAVAPAIQWRLENTFRMFKRPEDTDAMRTAYRTLATELGRAPTVLELEQRLATATGGWGWAENLVGHVVQDACWYRRDEACSPYARPTSHRVQVSLGDQTGACIWQLDGKPTAAEPTPCGTPVTLEVPYPDGADVTAIVDGAQVAATRITVRDLLIVGFGDSFASGEGNPDRAVRFQSGRVVRYGTSDPRLVGYPARVGDWRNTSDSVFADGAAQWLHRPCHRSLYSAHARFALHLALSDDAQQTSVTFLSPACTGAEIEDGLFVPRAGRDDAAAGEERVTLSQLSGVANAICAPGTMELGTENYTLQAIEGSPQKTRSHRIFSCPKEQARKIDLLLLSIGGNDIGFSKLVAWTSLSDVAEAALKGSLTRDPDRARPYLGALRHNYGELHRAVGEALHIEPTRVVLIAYPKMSFDERGATCRNGPDGMQVSPVFSFYSRRAGSVERFAESELTPLMKEEASAHGWLWVDAHREAALRHGFCARGGNVGSVSAAADQGFPIRRGARRASPDGGGMRFVAASSTGDGGDSRATPKEKKERREGGARAAGWLETVPRSVRWAPYSPSEYRPYLPRTRWFRSPNDAFLTVNLHFGTVGDRVNLTQFVASSGAFHPNAQGHAATADAIRDAVLKAGLLQ